MNPTSVDNSKSTEVLPPFSLKGLKETLLFPLNVYEKFANSNGSAIESIESALRSISYILPGRFKDSEFVSEILLSLLNLFRYYNDTLMLGNRQPLAKSMSLVQRNFVAYLQFLKSRHPLMKTLMTLLNLTKLLQIPLEMLVAKFYLKQKGLFVLVVECWKAVLKFGIWQGSGWRSLPRNFSISLDRLADDGIVADFDVEDDPRAAATRTLDIKMNLLDSKLKDSKSKEPLSRYLTGHKTNIYTESPNLNFDPCLEWKSWTRELTHIIRPSIYAASLLTLSSREGKYLKWLPLTLSFSMDLYSMWPELNSKNELLSTPHSSIESEERSRRLLDFLYYPIRAPLYESFTSGVLDSIEERIQALPLLSPLADTIKVYRKLCENVYFYTSAS